MLTAVCASSLPLIDAPVRRVGARDSFVPFAPNLEAAVLPSVEQIAQRILIFVAIKPSLRRAALMRQALLLGGGQQIVIRLIARHRRILRFQ